MRALGLVAELLTDPGDRILVENPGSPSARTVFGAAGVAQCPVGVDENGAILGADWRQYEGMRLAYLTPSHQAPLGATLSMERRVNFLAWAERVGAWIIEDDVGSEFRYAGRPLTALQGLDSTGRVLYIGSLSTVLFPAVALSYIVVPESLVEVFARAQSVMDHLLPTPDHAALAAFLRDGHLDRHLARLRSAYEERQAALLSAAEDRLSPWLSVTAGSAGTHSVAHLRAGLEDGVVAAAATRHGVSVRRLSQYYYTDSRQGLVLGYAGHAIPALREGICALHSALLSVQSAAPGWSDCN